MPPSNASQSNIHIAIIWRSWDVCIIIAWLPYDADMTIFNAEFEMSVLWFHDVVSGWCISKRHIYVTMYIKSTVPNELLKCIHPCNQSVFMSSTMHESIDAAIVKPRPNFYTWLQYGAKTADFSCGYFDNSHMSSTCCKHMMHRQTSNCNQNVLSINNTKWVHYMLSQHEFNVL